MRWRSRCSFPDCAFMIDRPMDVWGAPLEVEVLLFGCLKSCCQLMGLVDVHGSFHRMCQSDVGGVASIPGQKAQTRSPSIASPIHHPVDSGSSNPSQWKMTESWRPVGEFSRTPCGRLR